MAELLQTPNDKVSRSTDTTMTMENSDNCGPNDTTLDHAAPSKGWIVHLLSKTNAEKKTTFDLQLTTHPVMKLLKRFDPNISFLNQLNEHVDSEAEIGLTAPEFAKFATYKTAQINNGRTQHMVYFTARISKPFHIVKNSECINELHNMNIYLEKKAFRSTEYVVIGWFARLHPLITWKDDLLHDMAAVIAEITGQRPPDFDIIKRPKKFGNKRRIETKVYEIECDKKDVEALTDALIDKRFMQATEAMFVPANLTRNAGPEVYSMILTSHTKYCNEIETIPIFGLKPELLNQQDSTTGQRPIYDTIVDFADRTKIHHTSRSEESGKYIISFQSGQREIALTRFNEAVEIIKAMDFPKNAPYMLFDDQLPRVGQPPRKFTNVKLNSYASDLCSAFLTDQSSPTKDEPTYITLNTGRRYNGQQSRSFSSVASGGNSQTATLISQDSTLTATTDNTKVGQLESDVESIRRTMEDFIQEQRKVNVDTATKIDSRMSELKTSCLTHLTTLFDDWGSNADQKIKSHCTDIAAERYKDIDTRRRKVSHPNSQASPSASAANGTSDSPMAEVDE